MIFANVSCKWTDGLLYLTYVSIKFKKYGQSKIDWISAIK